MVSKTGLNTEIFGNLDQNQSGDWDADGFSNAQENSLGQEPTIKDSVQDGGISSVFLQILFLQTPLWFTTKLLVTRLDLFQPWKATLRLMLRFLL